MNNKVTKPIPIKSNLYPKKNPSGHKLDTLALVYESEKKQINKRMLAAKIIIEGVLIALNNKLNKQQRKLAIKRILQTNSY